MTKLNYWSHQPLFWKKWGEAIRNLGMAITGVTIYNDNHNAALISLGLTWLGNTLINFTSEPNTVQAPPSTELDKIG